MQIESTVSGIPCLIDVITFNYYAGCASADSDWDYYGDTEIEFAVLDRRGRPAPWLERKLTNEETSRIEEEIIEAMEDNRRNGYF